MDANERELEREKAERQLDEGTDAAADRFGRWSDATDRFYDAEADQVGATFELFNAWLGEEWVDDKQAAESVRDDLRSAWSDASAKKEALKSASEDKKADARKSLAESLARMKATLREAGKHLRGRGEKAPAPHA